MLSLSPNQRSEDVTKFILYYCIHIAHSSANTTTATHEIAYNYYYMYIYIVRRFKESSKPYLQLETIQIIERNVLERGVSYLNTKYPRISPSHLKP